MASHASVVDACALLILRQVDVDVGDGRTGTLKQVVVRGAPMTSEGP